MTTNKYFVLRTYSEGTEGFLRGDPITTEAVTLAQARGTIAWQVKGGFDAANYTICEASEIAGIMTPKGDPKTPVLLMKGALTLIAYRDMICRIWGASDKAGAA
jgi:hypothetical protein